MSRAALVVVVLACVVAVASAYPVNMQYAQRNDFNKFDRNVNWRQNVLQNAFNRDYLDEASETGAYEIVDEQLTISPCPANTVGVTVPSQHTRFWHALPLTLGVAWTLTQESINVMCVPLAVQPRITTIVTKLSTPDMVTIDPLTVPQFAFVIQQAREAMGAPRTHLPRESLGLHSAVDKIETIKTLKALKDINDLEEVTAMETMGKAGFGRWGFGFPGYGFGRFGWGGFPAFGLGYGYGVPFGLGWGGLGWF